MVKTSPGRIPVSRMIVATSASRGRLGPSALSFCVAYDPHVARSFRQELDVRPFGEMAHPDTPVEKRAETGEVSIDSGI